MKCFLTLLILFFIADFGFGQVGIGTTKPEADLHIAGENSTIRIEGLNSSNNILNPANNLVPVSVDGLGNFTLVPQFNEPIVFLVEEDNFIEDNPNALSFRSGSIINSDTSVTEVQGQIATVTFTLPQEAIIEVNYAVTMMMAAGDLESDVVTPITDRKARSGEIFYAIDVHSDGLNMAESEKKYGFKGIYFASENGGIAGYAYVNSQGYTTLPAGEHTLHFFGIVKDDDATYTSVGFGGSKDYLKIRLFN